MFILKLEQTNSLTDQCLSCDTGLVQINLQIQWPQNRINILDVLKPTEEEISKYYKQLGLQLETLNEEASSNKSSISCESPQTSENLKEDNDREEQNSSMKRNQKPSKLCPNIKKKSGTN